jgi:uncharacterized peroxidase-related enzyme
LADISRRIEEHLMIRPQYGPNLTLLVAATCGLAFAIGTHAQAGADRADAAPTHRDSTVQTPTLAERSMTQYTKQTIELAPEGAGQALARLKQSAGVIPNLAATMAESPALIDGFVTLREVYQQRATLDPKEREILGVANAVANRCEWCVAFHSFVAGKLGVDPATVNAIRTGQAPADPRARALTRFTNQLIERRGAIDSQELDTFLAAGFTKQQALEVVTGLALSLMANYAGNFVEPELDAFLVPTQWSAPSKR